MEAQLVVRQNLIKYNQLSVDWRCSNLTDQILQKPDQITSQLEESPVITSLRSTVRFYSLETSIHILINNITENKTRNYLAASRGRGDLRLLARMARAQLSPAEPRDPQPEPESVEDDPDRGSVEYISSGDEEAHESGLGDLADVKFEHNFATLEFGQPWADGAIEHLELSPGAATSKFEPKEPRLKMDMDLQDLLAIGVTNKTKTTEEKYTANLQNNKFGSAKKSKASNKQPKNFEENILGNINKAEQSSSNMIESTDFDVFDKAALPTFNFEDYFKKEEKKMNLSNISWQSKVFDIYYPSFTSREVQSPAISRSHSDENLLILDEVLVASANNSSRPGHSLPYGQSVQIGPGAAEPSAGSQISSKNPIPDVIAAPPGLSSELGTSNPKQTNPLFLGRAAGLNALSKDLKQSLPQKSQTGPHLLRLSHKDLKHRDSSPVIQKPTVLKYSFQAEDHSPLLPGTNERSGHQLSKPSAARKALGTNTRHGGGVSKSPPPTKEVGFSRISPLQPPTDYYGTNIGLGSSKLAGPRRTTGVPSSGLINKNKKPTSKPTQPTPWTKSSGKLKTLGSLATSNPSHLLEGQKDQQQGFNLEALAANPGANYYGSPSGQINALGNVLLSSGGANALRGPKAMKFDKETHNSSNSNQTQLLLAATNSGSVVQSASTQPTTEGIMRYIGETNPRAVRKKNSLISPQTRSNSREQAHILADLRSHSKERPPATKKKMKIRERDPQSTPNIAFGIFTPTLAAPTAFVAKKPRKKKTAAETTADHLDGPNILGSYNPAAESSKLPSRATTAQVGGTAKREANATTGSHNLRIQPLEFSQLVSEEVSHLKIGGSIGLEFGNKSPKGLVGISPLGQLYPKSNPHMLSLASTHGISDHYGPEDTGTPVGKNLGSKNRILSGNPVLQKTDPKLATTPSGALSKVTTNSMAHTGVHATAKKKRPGTGGAPSGAKQRLKSAKPTIKAPKPQMGLILDSGTAAKQAGKEVGLRKSLEKFSNWSRPTTGTSKAAAGTSKRNALEHGLVAQNSIEDVETHAQTLGNSRLVGLRESKEGSHMGIHGSATKKPPGSHYTGFSAYQNSSQATVKPNQQLASKYNKAGKLFGKGAAAGDFEVTSPQVQGLNLFQSIGVTSGSLTHEPPYFSQRGPSNRVDARKERELQTHTSNNPKRPEKHTVNLNLLAGPAAHARRKEELQLREGLHQEAGQQQSQKSAPTGGVPIPRAGEGPSGEHHPRIVGLPSTSLGVAFQTQPGGSVLASPAKQQPSKPLGKNSASLLERGTGFQEAMAYREPGATGTGTQKARADGFVR